MIGAFWRRVRIVLRFLLPDARTRQYVRGIRRSGLFDRVFYTASNPRLRRIFRLAPERHYALFGEPAGLCPNPAFSPRAYLYNNPDIEGTAPLLHYIQSGRAEGRTVLNAAGGPDLALPIVTPADRPRPPSEVAVVLHLFYHDLWDEFAPVLASQEFDFDLYVTATGSDGDVAPLRARVLEAFPRARIWAMPNHGRDMFPFLYLAGSGLLSCYDAVCKLHGKRSPHRADGERWRQALVAGVMGDPARTARRLGRFLADPGAGLWVADDHIFDGDEWWGMNRPRAEALLARAGCAPAQGALRFPAGSVYWVKPAVLEALSDLGLQPGDFEPEQALVDGTTAHALERAMGALTTAAGLNMCTARDLGR